MTMSFYISFTSSKLNIHLDKVVGRETLIEMGEY